MCYVHLRHGPFKNENVNDFDSYSYLAMAMIIRIPHTWPRLYSDKEIYMPFIGLQSYSFQVHDINFSVN